MNSTIIAALIALVVLGGGLFYYNAMYPTGDMMMEKGDQMVDEGTKMLLDGAEMVDKGTEMKKEGESMKDEGSMMEDGAMEKAPEGTMMSAGSYEAYSPDKLAKANDGDVVLFFRASWCPTCRTLDSDIRANLSKIPKGVTILDVDYDNSTALKQKYGVTYQHTFVQVDAEGNQIAKWQGSPSLAALVQNIK